MEPSLGTEWFLRKSTMEQFKCDCEKLDTFPSSVEFPLKEVFIWPKTIKFNMKLFKKFFKPAMYIIYERKLEIILPY